MEDSIRVTFNKLAHSYVLLFIHSIWIAYSFKKNRKLVNATDQRPLLERIMTFILLSLGGGIAFGICTGKPQQIFTHDVLLPIYLCGFFLIEFETFYSLLQNHSQLPEYVMDCIVDPFVRSIAITNAIDSFNSMNLNRQPSPGLYLGQWLIGILVSTTGGFALNAMKCIYTIKNNHLILGVSCVLYILFDSQIYWHVFRLDIGHEINDYKICIAAFNVSFFTMRRIVDDNGEDITKYLERKEELLECKEVEENELIEKLNVNGIETTVQRLSKGDTSDIKARVVEEITKRSSKRLSKLA